MDNHQQGLVQSIVDRYGQSYFEALAGHPTQAALGLKAITVDLAQLVCTEDQRASAKHASWDDIAFTATQERDFAKLQIQLNSYLDSVAIPRMPLLHLSPRMLLDKPQAVAQANENQAAVIEGSIVSSKRQKKRRKQSRKAANEVSDVDINDTSKAKEIDITPVARDTTSVDTVLDKRSTCHIDTATSTSSARYDYTIPKDDYTEICNNLQHERDLKCVNQTCDAYEEILLRIREQHDTILQSLNMRLFIAQTEIENLKDSLLLRGQIDALS